MKSKRFILFIFSLFLLILFSLAIEYYYLHIETDVTTRFIIVFLFNFTIISLLTLVFFVSKNFIRLIIEKRRRIIGYKFKTRLVIIFVGLTLVPSALLFLIASGIVTNYIDRWFDPQIKQPLEDSLELSRTFYETERERTINKARAVIRGEVLRDNIKVRILNELPENPSETIKEAFEGKEGTEVISRDEGDIIRAVIPEIIGGKIERVFVTESVVPLGIVRRIDNVKLAQERYTTMKKLKMPLKLNYLLILAFFTSLIVFMAMWVSLKISKGITEPIGRLAQATEEIATGNLGITIDIQRDDEIGMLVTSFNRMVKELKESKKSLENAYMDSNRRRISMESILENIDSGVISLDNSGNIQTINSSACKILGIDQSLLVASKRDYTYLLSYIDSEEFRSFIKSINLRDFKTIKEQISISVRGKKLILRMFITQLTLTDGQPIGMLVVFDDLTDVIRAQQALTWQDIARRIAHEIKNPLTPIKLSAERILKKWNNKSSDIDVTIQNATNTIIREVESLRKLVDEFSKFGKMPEIKKKHVNIKSLLSEIVELYRDYVNINIILDFQDEISKVQLDPEHLKRVIINLFDNAINAMEGNGEITVSVLENTELNSLSIEITDTGPGIDEKDVDKLFLPYFSTKRGGTGLGLAISHRIIVEHGGNISVENNSPQGAKFTIQLPM